METENNESMRAVDIARMSDCPKYHFETSSADVKIDEKCSIFYRSMYVFINVE